MTWKLTVGDSAKKLKKLKANSIDALITDPPAGISFMNKGWDDDKGGRDEWIKWLSQIMKEAKRVMKPGAYGLVWALPRTSHWTATALEDAGFEIRDIITHHFGSGFPKSHNVGKGIDRLKGKKGKQIGTSRGVTTADNQGYGGFARGAVGIKQVGMDVPIIEPATPEAKQWQGWGTALKPASEHWILIRKPFNQTVAKNVLEHGTGALNIDESRIGGDGTRKTEIRKQKGAKFRRWNEMTDDSRFHNQGYNDPNRTEYVSSTCSGRWPANLVLTHHKECKEVCHTDCPVAELDEQSGDSNSSDGKWLGEHNSLIYGKYKVGIRQCTYTDNGGASRFFYVAKPSTKEKDAGMAAENVNNHPTVKPLQLMRYFAKMITPPNGTILDPFTGSGTTGMAAVIEGFSFIGIELEQESADIASTRIEWADNLPAGDNDVLKEVKENTLSEEFFQHKESE